MVRIRPATAADVPAITALYRSLSPASTMMRFSSSRLLEETLRRVAALQPGDFALLGEDAGRVVAEARWCRTGDVPELALTVADDYQHLGLGPALLNRLRAAAQRRGIHALAAMVRTDNAEMIRLLLHVGCVLVEPVRDATAEFEVGTDELMPAWPDRHDRLRVLVESQSLFDDDGTVAARAAGADVRKCLVGGAGGRECPLLALGHCRLAEGADVVACLVRDPAAKDALAAAHRAADRRVVTTVPEWRQAARLIAE